MRRIRLPFLLLVLITLLVLTTMAYATANTTLTFDDANNLTVNNASYTFKGSITTTERPEDLTYTVKVFRTSVTNPIDQSAYNRPLVLQDEWTFRGGTFSNTFSFEALFGSYTGPMTIYVEVKKGGSTVAIQPLSFYVKPIQLTLNNNGMTVKDRYQEFTGNVAAYTSNLTFSYKVLDRQGNIIDRSSTTKVVTLATWTQNTNSVFLNSLKFTADFGSYTGEAKVVLEAKDGGTLAVTQTINVTVQKPTVTTPVQLNEFKNQGQLISYLSQRLQVLGYGNHKNLGQALNFCKNHRLFANTKTSLQAEELLRQVLQTSATQTPQQKGKRAF